MTSNLKPYQAYKETSIEWLGAMPGHWKRMPGKACFQLKQVSNKGSGENTVLSLSYGQIKIKPQDKLHGLVPESFETYQIVNPGDIICRPTDLQNDWNSLRFGLSNDRGIITSAYMCFRTYPVLLQEYGHLLLHAYDLKKIFYGLGSGLRQNLDWKDFKYLPCFVPPLPEQSAIVRFLDYADKRIRRYIRAKQKLIKLLEEQKQAIIYHAVTRGLNPNVRLKPSGLPWLGDIPEHWELFPNRAMLRKRKILVGDRHGDYKLLSLTKAGVIVRDISTGRGKFSADMGTSQEIREGDLIFCLFDVPETPRTVGLSKHHGMITGAYTVFECRDSLLTKFIEAFYIAMDDRKLMSPLYSGLRNTIPPPIFLGVKTPIPPPSEQATILDFIDQSTANVDYTIDRTRREIELLREYRTCLIADVVTGKLDVREAAASLPDEEEESAAAEELEDIGETLEENTENETDDELLSDPV